MIVDHHDAFIGDREADVAAAPVEHVSVVGELLESERTFILGGRRIVSVGEAANTNECCNESQRAESLHDVDLISHSRRDSRGIHEF